MHTLLEFKKQFNLQLSTKQEQLLNSYQPCSLEMPRDTIAQFVEQLPNAIDQCALCSSSHEKAQIYPVIGKKVKFFKR